MEDMTPSPRAPKASALPGHSRRLAQLTFDGIASSRDQLDQPVGLIAAQPLSLIDRTAELAAIHRQLVEESVRLLTLTGPAGVGKTRLALAAAEQLATNFRDGVVFVDFAPIREPHRVVPAIAQALTFADTGPRPLMERLRDYLHERTLLLLLDNFEHVLGAANRLANLLAVGPHVAMLVTSRTPLHLRWEHVLRVPPLLVPQLTPLPSLDELAQVPAVAFFLERAHARRADFTLSATLAPLVAQLVVHLDGLPLALELAAARLDTLSVPLLVQQLGDRLQMLESPMPDAPARQHSLEAAIGWSYDLLGDEEQRLFRCLGVFAGRVALDAITAVVADVRARVRHTEGDHHVDEGRTLPELLSLAEQSLLLPARPTYLGWQQGGIGEEAVDEEDEEAVPAFGELETVREYAAERLAAAGELETARRAHAHFFLALAERANVQLRGREQRPWFFRLERGHDNLRAALRWLLDREDDSAERAAGLRLASALGYFWWLRGYHAEGARWLEEALARAPYREQGDKVDPAGATARAMALRWAGALLTLHGELERARTYLEEAQLFAQKWRDPAGIALALTFLGQRAVYAAEGERAVLLLEEALSCARAVGEPHPVGLALFFLGVATHARGHATEAAVHYAEALGLFEAAGDERSAGAVHVELGVIAGQQGDMRSALRHLRAALEASERLRDRWLLSLGARAALAVVVSVQGDPVGRLRLVGAADALRQGTGGGRVPPGETLGPDQIVAALRTPVPEGEREVAYREGRALPAREVVHLALRLLDEAASSRSYAEAVPAVPETLPQDAAGGSGGQLTGREVEVLQLVAQGLANKAIARQLCISPSTVNYHLTAIFNKLVVDTRAQAVAVATRRGLL